jgi:hypothetical protein
MPSVMIAEDDLLVADMLEETLIQAGYDVCGIARTVETATGIRPTITATPFVPRCHAAFKTVSKIDITAFGEGDDDLLLRRVCHRHLVMRRHALFMLREILSRSFRHSVARTSEPSVL